MRHAVMAALFGDREDPRRRLAALFDSDVPASGRPPEPALRWADGVLGQPDAPARRNEVVAIRALRTAEPRLTLRAARFLARHALQRV